MYLPILNQFIVITIHALEGHKKGFRWQTDIDANYNHYICFYIYIGFQGKYLRTILEVNHYDTLTAFYTVNDIDF